MKLNLLKSITMLALVMVMVGCKDKANEAETTAAENATEAKATSVKYMVDASSSTIEWTGFKPTGKHNGTLNLESGVFTVNNNALESGSFLLDMNSIVVLDIPAEEDSNADLVGHLKNADFFDVENHANAAFDVTGFETKDGKNLLSGNLTMKGIKHNVTFPVNVTTEGDVLTINSEAFTIDRTKWDIKYKSKSVFGDLGDKFINDDIELKVTVKAKKS
ncbi:YceI family protein [Pontimicrobium sp. IMCC45349]|uniref:YceI family protein n=1 Tax=Pontimicrobium sp. IMCC45349 TaxID=3391574 RepID=UPI0039A08FDB